MKHQVLPPRVKPTLSQEDYETLLYWTVLRCLKFKQHYLEFNPELKDEKHEMADSKAFMQSLPFFRLRDEVAELLEKKYQTKFLNC